MVVKPLSSKDNRFLEIVETLPIVEGNPMHKIRVLNLDSELINPENSLERTFPVS